MSDEIKEILEDVKRHLDYVEATKQSSIRDNEMKAMYDYITNLQEEIHKKEAMYDSLAVDYRLSQEENKRLNNIINELEKYINKTKLEEFEKVYGKRYGKTFTQAEIVICNMILDKLKELKESNNV